jgi:nitroreductase
MSGASIASQTPEADLRPPRAALDLLREARPTEADVAPWFVHRWSPRSFTEEPVDPGQVRTLFEAARWAPSSANEQPWLFVYGTSPADRERLLQGLHPFNQAWAGKAPVLAFLFARRFRRDSDEASVPNPIARFDTGAAWMSLALQAELLGLSAHAMGGIEPDRVYEVTGVPKEEYEVMVGIAVGHRGEADRLPAPFAEREKPSPRRPLAEIARELGPVNPAAAPTPA